MELDTRKFTDKLKQIYTTSTRRRNQESRYDSFVNAIRDSKALIAGGSVLSAYSPKTFKISDFDIYVNASNANELYNKLINIGYSRFGGNSYIAPAYDQSFFCKNNI